MKTAIEALTQLARMGSGNSLSNQIAQDALTQINKEVQKAETPVAYWKYHPGKPDVKPTLSLLPHPTRNERDAGIVSRALVFLKEGE